MILCPPYLSITGELGKQQIRYCGRENPWLEDNQAGVVVQPEVVFTVRPNRSTGYKCMVATNQRYSHWCLKSWILFVVS